MSESALTPHTAPRSIEGLLKETPFKLRLLAQALGGLASEEQKMGWHQLQTNDARAQHILTLLQGWDQQNPGQARAPMNGATPHAPPPQQQAPQAPPQQQYQQPPMQQQQAPQGYIAQPPPPLQAPQQFQAPVQTQFQMPSGVQPMAPVGPAQVSPQAAAAAQQAAGEKPSGRKPRNSAAAGGAGDADVGGQVLTMLQQILVGLGSDAERFQALQQNLTNLLEEAASAKTGRVTALEAKYGEVAAALQHISGALQSQSQVQLWTLMAFLTLASEQTGASVTDLLGAAISDSAMFQQLVDKATGKA